MSKQFPHPFSDLAKRFRAYHRTLPRVVSVLAQEHFRRNFRKQGAHTGNGGALEKWAPRKDGSDRGRAILVKTGRLRRSLRTKPTGSTARVVNDAPYAAIHNRGGPIRGQMRTWSTNMRTGLTRLRASHTPAKMPARPFMVMDPKLEEAIRKEVSLGLEEVFNGAKSQ